VATEIYATGVHPYNLQPVFVAKSPEEKQEQRGFFFWYKPEMRGPLRATLHRLGMDDIAAELLRGGGGAKGQMISEEDTAHIRRLAPKPHKPWFRKGRSR
jgi:hypothetical protein